MNAAMMAKFDMCDRHRVVCRGGGGCNGYKFSCLLPFFIILSLFQFTYSSSWYLPLVLFFLFRNKAASTDEPG